MRLHVDPEIAKVMFFGIAARMQLQVIRFVTIDLFDWGSTCRVADRICRLRNATTVAIVFKPATSGSIVTPLPRGGTCTEERVVNANGPKNSGAIIAGGSLPLGAGSLTFSMPSARRTA